LNHANHFRRPRSGLSKHDGVSQHGRLAGFVSYEQELWTYQDAVEYLLDYFEVPRSSRALRMAKRAVLYAHRTLPTLHKWPYYQRLHVVNTVAPYSTGTISFDYTEGTYERLVTLSGGVFPAWTQFGVMRIANVDYPVLQRLSNTQCTLTNWRAPPADIAAGASFTLFRNHYPLPLDFRRGDRIIDQISGRELCSVSPSALSAQQLHQRGTTTPYIAAIVEDEDHIGGVLLHINAPTSASQYSFLYERQPRPMNTEKYDAGTLTLTEDSAQITGVGTAFTRSMVGAVLRISGDDEPPQSKIGSLASAEDNPAAHTRIVMNVTDGTTIQVDETLTESASGRAYTISDPVDLHVHSMLDAFLKCAEWEFARLLARKDASQRMADFFSQLDIARDAVRHQTAIQTVDGAGSTAGYSLIGSVTARPDL
jgi:hypothetical protein